MKIFKQILSLILLFSLTSVDAKRRSTQAPRSTAPTTQQVPAPKPAPAVPPAARQRAPERVQKPVRVARTQPQSYAQALNVIKTEMQADEVLINNRFNPEFINFIESLNLSPLETTALLQAGANMFATWTDNNETNKNILSSLKKSIQIIMQNQPQPEIWKNPPIMPPKPVEYTQPIIQPKPVVIPKPAIPIEQPKPVAIPKPIMPLEQAGPVIAPKPIMLTQPIVPVEQPLPVVIPKPITPIEPPRPVIAPKPITEPSLINKVPRDLLGKVKKLEGYDGIYVGAGISAAGEPIFFAMEKLNAERNEVWQKYISALYTSYYTQVIARLRKLNNKCDDQAFLETLNNDPYTKKLMEQMCPQKKFSALFGGEDGIGGGIVGFDQMLHRYSEDGDVVYVVYASSEPITGPFKPKKEIDPSSDFTLEDFETAYSNLIICVAVDMMQKLKLPISTEHRGIFKNPFNEIRGGYKNIALQLHAWAGKVEEQFFNKKYMTVFPTEHAAKLLHSSTKKGEMYLGTDKKPFPYNTYYKNDNELKLIKEKFPPIQQDLIGDAPTISRGGGLEHLHVFPLNTLSTYYTNQGKE